MTIDHIRRGIEFDTLKAIRNLEKHDGNPSAYEIADCVAEHIEKFAYICSDEPADELIAQVSVLASTVSEAAKELTHGEKYYVHDEQIAARIKDRVERFKRDVAERPVGLKF